jgi:hypothetical protein
MSVAVAAYLVIAIYALPSATWDALTYHLTAVGAWFRSNHILVTPLTVKANTNPMNGELTLLWVQALARSDLLIELPQLVFAFIGAFAVGVIARTVGVSRAGAVVAAALYFLTPTVVGQATTNYVDLVLPGLYLAGYAFLLRNVLELHASPLQVGIALRTGYLQLAFAGVACGLAAGSKTNGALYAAVAVIVLAGNLLWWQRRARVAWAAVGRAMVVFVVPVIALGSFWYVRTWVEYGSPTYPYSASVGGLELSPGPFDLDQTTEPPGFVADLPTPLRAIGSWVRLTRVYAFDQRLGGFGPQWLLLELPALVAFTIYCLARRRVVLWNFLLPIFVIAALTPTNWWPRLIVILVAPACVAIPFLVERIRRPSGVLALQIASVVLVGVGLVISARRTTIPGHTFSIAAVLTDATKPRSDRTLGTLILHEYAWADEVPKNSRIGLVPEDFHKSLAALSFVSPLFGTDFRNDVVAVRESDVTKDGLVAALRRSRIDYFVTRASTELDVIARRRPNALDFTSSRGGLRVYRVLPH